ncbi:MAG: PP2C family protein-serine/threonine phosphatase [Wenzhouxiangellaceae bacterium]
MYTGTGWTGLPPEGMEAILDVASAIAAPIDLATMVERISDAARQILHAREVRIWLFEQPGGQLVLGGDGGSEPLQSADQHPDLHRCLHEHRILTISEGSVDAAGDGQPPDAPGLKAGGTMNVPLVDHDDQPVGVMQVINKLGGRFGPQDEALAGALATQCVAAVQRVCTTDALLEGERMHGELMMAWEVQMSTLPEEMPRLEGYDLYGVFQPAGLTGGDTFDLIDIEQGLFILLGDATGHGIAPALSATQMQAMLRVAFRAGADLEAATMHTNNQLLEDLPADRFVTAFIGLLDAKTHNVRFHSAGQGPILLYQAGPDRCLTYGPTSFPLAVALMQQPHPADTLKLEPGDILALLSDGIFEYHNPSGEQFGEERAIELIRAGHDRPVAELAEMIFEAVETFSEGAPQADDMTIVLVKRRAAGP